MGSAVCATITDEPAAPPTGRPGRTGMVAGVLETVFLILLAATFGLIAWAAAYAVYRLYQGQH